MHTDHLMITNSIRSRSSDRAGNFLPLVAALIALAALLPGVTIAQDDDAVVLEVGSITVTRSEFDDRFDIAARTLALQQGLEPTDENLAEFEPERERFLDQLATQMVLLDEAEDQGVTVTDDEVDQTIENFRSQFETDDAFRAQLEALGFETVDELRTSVHENLRIQTFVETLAQEVDISQEDVRAFYDERPEQFQTEDGATMAFEDVERQVEEYLVRQALGELVQDIRAAADVQTYPENI